MTGRIMWVTAGGLHKEHVGHAPVTQIFSDTATDAFPCILAALRTVIALMNCIACDTGSLCWSVEWCVGPGDLPVGWEALILGHPLA